MKIENGLYIIDNGSVYNSICGTYAIINGMIHRNDLRTRVEYVDSVLDSTGDWVWNREYFPKDSSTVMYELQKVRYEDLDDSYLLYKWEIKRKPVKGEDILERWEGALYEFDGKLAFIVRIEGDIFIHLEGEDGLRKMTPEEMSTIKSSVLEKIEVNE